MNDLPELTIGVCVYKRPEYALITLASMKNKLNYSGAIRFCIAGVWTNEQQECYSELLRGYEIAYRPATNFADMCNVIADEAGEVWVTMADDYWLNYRLDITPDVAMLLRHSEIGCVRLAQMSLWGDHPEDEDPKTSADLIQCNGLHWWRLDKERTQDSYMSGIFCHLYHRRFWVDYGDIPACPPNNPGQGEINGAARFRAKPGCTIAVPMRFGESTLDRPEPFFHFGAWHQDDYAALAGKRTRAVWFDKPRA